jgi:hypothetical protein
VVGAGEGQSHVAGARILSLREPSLEVLATSGLGSSAGFPPCADDPRLLASLDAWGTTVFVVSIVGTITVSS